MRASRDHILTSQAGSLPRPDDLIEANRAREAGETTDEKGFRQHLRAAVVDVVRRQEDIGIDVPGDGEFGKSMGSRVNYGTWWNYAFTRLAGLDLASRPGLHDQTGTAKQAGSDRSYRHGRPARPQSLPRHLWRPGRSREHRTAQSALAGLRRS